MTAKKKITDKNGVQVYPITHTKAVLDDNGNSVEQRLQEQMDVINQKQLEVGAVPSDLTPTAGSTNWVTSGGIKSALDAINEKTGHTDYYSISAQSGRYSYVTLPMIVGKKYYITLTLDTPAVGNQTIYMSKIASDNGPGTSPITVGNILDGESSMQFVFDVTYENEDNNNLKGAWTGSNYTVSVSVEEKSKIAFNSGEKIGEISVANAFVPVSMEASKNLLSAQTTGIPDMVFTNKKKFTTDGTAINDTNTCYCVFNAKAGDVLSLYIYDRFASGAAMLISKVGSIYNKKLSYGNTNKWKSYIYIVEEDCDLYVNISQSHVDNSNVLIRHRNSVALVSDVTRSDSDRTIYVAASNSSDTDKFYSDYVCDGTNDELTIKEALSNIFGANKSGGTLVLRNGDYYFDAITSNNSFIYMSFGTTYPNHSLKICGDHVAMSLNDKDTAGACIHITSTAYNSMDSSTSYSIFKFRGDDYRHKVMFDELTIKCYWNQKKIIGLDFSSYNGAVKVLNMQLYCFDNYPDYGQISVGNPPALAVDGNIGIKMCSGSSPNGTYGNNYENVSVTGFYEGFAVCGEHVFMKMCSALFCNYGYTFQRYGGNNEHTSVLLKCVDERNKCLPKFFNKRNGNGLGQAILILGLSCEHASNIVAGGAEQGTLACEATPGSFCGEITYTLGGFGRYNVGNTVDKPFWQHGHGERFKTTNLCQDISCTSSTRKGYAPNYLQRIWDTTLRKEVICVATPSYASISLTVTGLPSSTGTISIVLGTKTYSVSLTETSYSTTTELAAAIASLYRASKVNCYNDGSTIHFDDTYLGIVSSVSFNPRQTGMTGTIEIVSNGTNAVWADVMGDIVD